ncbi:ankyrin repeat-containing domain protein [Microdochium trichocladiopsis]|uniref:Ankyrin repeat-containing domain protein n=1 Tax=Microdochium trichocladiopsis TaxID=1682393 RepID=A0A9P9BLG1_9PEZI|nr:ankyrin repeat-containing domain protein [Microdochium trichocladiopsis]KAH7024882.1 ankyrin repeat-containing domain protein [Microdochium trichocladiopsis]
MAGPLSSALGPSGLYQSLEDALAGFQAVLSDDQRQELQGIKKNHVNADADAVLVFTASLDSINRQRRGRSTSTRLHSFLSSVGDFCTTMTDGKPVNIADTYVSSHPEIAALVWGSVKLTMIVITNFMSYNDGIFKLLMEITKFCPVASEYRSLYPDSTRLQKTLSNFYAAVIRCCRHLVQVMQRRGYMQVARKLATSFDQEFRPDLDDIRSHRKSVTEEVALAKAQVDLHHHQLQATERQKASHSRKVMGRFFSSTENSLHKIGTQQIQSSNYESARRRQQLLDSLSSHDFRRPFKQANERRYGNTTRWVFDTPQFQQWLDGESPVLWCSGKIGSGKTIVASSAIHHLLNVKGSLGCPISFFFAEYDDAASLNPDVILRSILRQMLQGTKISQAMGRSIQSMISSPTSSDLSDLLRELTQVPLKSYIVIDGVDQCEAKDRKELLKTLSTVAIPGSNTRLFLSGRNSLQDELHKYFPGMGRLKLDCEATTDDIATYIKGFLDEKLKDGDLVVRDPTLVGDVRAALEKGAQGMFLWASLQLEDICRQHCDADIRHTLDNLPGDLAGTFLRALRRIESQKQGDTARKIFPWVAAAKRPLTLGELREAIAIEIGQEYSEPDRLYNNMGRAASWCENLIQVDEESQVVQFVHSTVKDFLMQDPQLDDTAAFHVRLDDADHGLGELCVTYLNFNDFKTALAVRSKPLLVDPSNVTHELFKPGSKRATLARQFLPKSSTGMHDMRTAAAFRSRESRSTSTTLEDGHPLLNYARVHWITHTKSFSEGKSKTWHHWKNILIDGHAIAEKPWGNRRNEIWTWALESRHFALIQLLLTTSTFRDGFSARIVYDATTQNDSQLMDIFLEASLPLGILNVALLIASSSGKHSMVERLVDAKADVNAVSPSSGSAPPQTALQAAAAAGYLDVIERLLGAKGNVNAAPSQPYGQTALQGAAGRGHLNVVDRLLEAKAEVNASPSGYNGRTALQAAAEGGHLDVVDRLLEAKAEVNAVPSGSGGRTALQAAAEGGHLDVVDRLLEANAKVNASPSGRYGRTALQAAAEGGHLDVVDRLLEAKAEVNASPSGYNGRTALQAAAEGGHLNVVDRLLEVNAEVNAKPTEFGRTALQAAAEGGHLNVVDRLLEVKAKVNAVPSGSGGRTALQAAAEGGHLDVVDRLLEAKAEVNASPSGYNGRTALQAAAEGGHLDVVDRLLEAKAEVNASPSGYYGRTALQAAAGGGHLDIIERLLKAKAEVNAVPSGSGGRTALQAAAEGGHTDVVHRLQRAGAR